MWPFKRKQQPAPPQEVWRAAPQAWRDVPPLQRVIADPPIVNPSERFSDTLAAWQDPTFLAPLGHRVTPQEPAGVVHDLVVPSKTPDMPVRTLPTVQKASEGVQMPSDGPPTLQSTNDTPTAQLIAEAPTLGASSPPDDEPQAEPLPELMPESTAEPALSHVEPAFVHVEPALLHVEPAFVHVEPALLHVEPAPSRVEPAPARVERAVEVPTLGHVVARAEAGPLPAGLPFAATSPPVVAPLQRAAEAPPTLPTLPVQRSSMIGGEPEALSRVQVSPDQLVFQRTQPSPMQTVRAEAVVQREPAESIAPLLGSPGLMPDAVEQPGAAAVPTMGLQLSTQRAVTDAQSATPTSVQRTASPDGVLARPVPSGTSPLPVSTQPATVQTARMLPSATVVPMRTVVAAPVQRAVVSQRVVVQRDLAEDLYTDAPPDPPTPPEQELPAEVATEPPPPASATAAPAPPAAVGGGAEPEELLKTLFDPLLRKLRTELRLDRERRGVVTDMSRW